MANIYDDYGQLKSVPNPLANYPGVMTTTGSNTFIPVNNITGTHLQDFNERFQQAVASGLKLVNPLPKDATEVSKKVYPFREAIVFKHNMKYYFKKVKLHDDGSMNLKDDYEDLQVAGNPSGLQIEGLLPEQFIVATMDYLETISPDADPEHTEALKHLKYALAYLEKSNMEKAKQNALKNKS